MATTLKDAVKQATATATTAQAAPAAARPVSTADIDNFFPTAPTRSKPANRSYRVSGIGFAPKQGNGRFAKIIGALFLLAFAGYVWLLSESTTLAIPRIFTNALDAQPWNLLVWVPLLAMSFLIVAHPPRPGLLSIKDLWWAAFTLADTVTTAFALLGLATQKLQLQHINIASGTANYYAMVVGCTLLAMLAVFAPISTIREAIRLIRWEI